MHIQCIYTGSVLYIYTGSVLYIYTGSVMDTGQEQNVSKHGDVNTLESTVQSVLTAHYPQLAGHVAFRLVPCGNVCADSLHLLAR